MGELLVLEIKVLNCGRNRNYVAFFAITDNCG